MVNELLQRNVTTGDVEGLLCGPLIEELPDDHGRAERAIGGAQKAAEAFIDMVEGILSRKEEDERLQDGISSQ